MWPPALLDRPIKAMCPQKVCTVCGEPSRRIVEADRQPVGGPSPSLTVRDEQSGSAPGGTFAASGSTTYTTVGWTDCGHDAWRNGIVLDPFAGSGTTLMVATGHGRDAIGFDLDERNAHLARDRIGMFLTEWTLDTWKREQAS